MATFTLSGRTWQEAVETALPSVIRYLGRTLRFFSEQDREELIAWGVHRFCLDAARRWTGEPLSYRLVWLARSCVAEWARTRTKEERIETAAQRRENRQRRLKQAKQFERLRDVRLDLSVLNPRYRKAMELRLAGYTWDEVARLTGYSRDGLMQALRIIRKMIG